MNESLIYRTDALVLVSVLFFVMLLAIFAGSRVGKLRYLRQEENAGNGTIVGSLFGLLAFLLAVTFGMSGGRFDSRREAVTNEANAIGTAILRSDLYTDSVMISFRKDFRNYLEARILYYEAGRDEEKVAQSNLAADSLAKRLWKRATDHSKNNNDFITANQMIPALNAMFDSASVNNIREKARVPDSIVVMLFVLSVASAFYAGYISAGKGRLDWFIIIGFCLLTSVVIYITLDLDRPRRGLINLNATHQAMLDLRKL